VEKSSEQVKAFSISEEEVVEMVMLKETVDGAFTRVADVSETALFLAS
jgi:3-hydroxybutyrate dehydrogenase